MSTLISVRQAIDILDAEAVQPRVVRLPLSQCRGLRLATDVLTDRDYPPFDKSLMDGYAVRAADVEKGQAELAVVGVVPAGHMPLTGIGPGESMAVMTGAPLPPGAEAVVPVEQSEELLGADGEGTGIVRLTNRVAAGYAVARKGSDMTSGQVVLSRGSLVDAPAIAVAASVGAAELDVYARPRVAVLGTGDEIVPIDQTPAAAQIRNSNNPMLVALLERLGCEVTDLGVVPDEPEQITAAIQSGLNYDVLFVTGGMSMGQFDYVPATLIELGCELKVTKVRLKPGKPFVFGVRHNAEARNDEEVGEPAPTASTYVFGLPGNPVSAYVCTLRLASRLLARIAGGMPLERWITGRLETGLPANGPREFYQPVFCRPPTGLKSAQNELIAIEPLAWRGSADVFTLARASGLLVRPENEPTLPKGTMVRVLEI